MTVAEARFVEIVRDVSGGNPKLPQSEYLTTGKLPVVDQGQSFVAGYTDDETYQFRSEQLPVVVFGDHTKAVKFVDFPFAMGADGVKVLKPKDRCDAKYLYHFLRHAKLPDAGYSRHFKFLKELKIPLPTLEEQRRITAILDKADALRAKRREAIAKLDHLLQSVFLDMFGDPLGNPRLWPTVKVGDVFSGFVGGKNVGCPDVSASPYRILKVSAVTSKVYRPEESKPAPERFLPQPEAIVEEGDLLFSRANTTELVAATAYVWKTPEKMVLPDKLWKMRVADKTRANVLFVLELFKNASFRHELSKRSSGTSGSMKNIAKSKLVNVPMPLPPISLQDRFAEMTEVVERQKRMLHAHAAEQEALFASLQHRAFTGTL